MAAKIQYLTYYIVLTDAEAVAAYQAQYPIGVNRAPYNPVGPAGAAVEFAAPFKGYIELTPAAAPYIWTPWHSASAGSTTTPFPTDVATFQRHTGGFLGIGGTTTRYYWIGQFVYAGTATAGAVNGGGEAEGADPPGYTKAPLCQRLWLDGFATPLDGAILKGADNGLYTSREAARTTGGWGLAHRGANTVSASVTLLKYTPLFTQIGSWERIYVRLRTLPSVTTMFWRCHGSPSDGAGIMCAITAAGRIAVYNVSAAGALTLLDTVATLPVWTGAFDDDAWVRLDLLPAYNSSGAGGVGRFRIYVNSVLVGNFSVAAADGGLGANSSSHVRSVIGEAFSVTNTLELDYSDWIGMVPPDGRAHAGGGYTKLWSAVTAYVLNDVVYNADEDHVYKCILANTNKEPTLKTNGTYWTRYEGLDWLNGSKIVLARPKAFGVNHDVLWAGDVRVLMQGAKADALDLAKLTSTTASSICEVTTDATETLDTEKASLGAAAMLVLALTKKGTTNGTLGYSINAAAFVQTALGEDGAAAAPMGVLYNSGGTTPVDVTPLALRYVKGADTTAGNIWRLVAQLELIGAFSRADCRPTTPARPWAIGTAYAVDDVVTKDGSYYTAVLAHTGVTPPNATYWTLYVPPVFPYCIGQHNAPYPRSAWGQAALAAPPSSSFIVQGGTYVGNGTGQDVTFRTPVHLFFARPVTGGAGGFLWNSAGAASHRVFGQQSSPLVVDAQEDLTFAEVAGEDAQQQRYRVRLAGADTQLNANGVTYQYIGICDPGQRFLLTGAFGRPDTTGTVNNLLTDPTFLPEFLLLMGESLNTTTTNRFYGKGSEQAAASIVTIAGTVLANALSFAAGALASQLALHQIGGIIQWAYACFRRQDGNDDPNEAGVFAIGGYTGDGAASRTIALANGTGKRPLFALVFAEGGVGYWRDPSHTLTNSTNSSGVDQTTGITGGGIDSFSVGSALNANGAKHAYLLFFADATAGNGGWGINGEYIPVEATSPASGPWPADPDEDDVLATNPEDNPPAEEPADPVEDPDLDNSTDLPGTDLFCVSYSQKCVNQALSRLGVSIQVADLANDTTQAAVLARLHLKQDVEFTLAAFPWEFARKYATLALLDGSPSDPVNADWTFSYRRPSDCIFERRIAIDRGTGVNPTPPAFAQGRDTSGSIVYTNQEDAVLEYTARGLCPAYEGDDLFKEALTWKLAASLAPALTRLEAKVADSWKAFDATIARAYDVQRPGNPGPIEETDAAALDASAAATAANVATANRALVRIGARTIAALSHQSREAESVRLVFEDELRATLREFPWQFATRYAELALVAGPATWDDALVQTWDIGRTYEANDAVVRNSLVYYAVQQTLGDDPELDTLETNWTADEPDDANADWLRAYRVPDNCVRARRLVKETARRVYDLEPSPFKLGTDEGGDVLFTDVEAAVLEYTERIAGVVSRSDALFKDAFAWRLAATLAPSLAQVDPLEVEQLGRGPDATAGEGKRPPSKANQAAQRAQVARYALARYYDVLTLAQAGNANEGQPEPDGDAPWIQGR